MVQSADSSLLRRLVRSKKTKAYLAPDGKWTSDIQKALSLSEFKTAQELRDQLKPVEIEIYYSFDQSRESQWDFVLPLH